MSRSVYILVLLTISAVIPTVASAQSLGDAPLVNFSVVHNFSDGADGAYPGYAGLIPDAAGNLYGTTTQGGAQTGACTATGGCGTIFKIDSRGNESVFYAFGPDTDGPRLPYGTLLRDANGNFYGTTWGGGTSGPKACNHYGCGTVYRVSASRQEKTIYNFSGGLDGATPTAGLTLGADGRLYSTTHNGGIREAGVVFAIDQRGAESVVYSFLAGDDGANTWAGLVRDPAGNFYGTTLAGGGFNANCGGEFGCGTIYEVTENGSETILYYFQGLDDGNWPYGGLIRDEEGNLYGTSQGGTGGWGTVFKLDSLGNFTVLHTFTGGTGGGSPTTTLVRDAAGTLYGTTLFGGGTNCPGINGCGTVFSLTKSGQFRVLHSFTGADGFWPSASVTLRAPGELYGTTNGGGAYNSGVVFKITR